MGFDFTKAQIHEDKPIITYRVLLDCWVNEYEKIIRSKLSSEFDITTSSKSRYYSMRFKHKQKDGRFPVITIYFYATLISIDLDYDRNYYEKYDNLDLAYLLNTFFIDIHKIFSFKTIFLHYSGAPRSKRTFNLHITKKCNELSKDIFIDFIEKLHTRIINDVKYSKFNKIYIDKDLDDDIYYNLQEKFTDELIQVY